MRWPKPMVLAAGCATAATAVLLTWQFGAGPAGAAMTIRYSPHTPAYDLWALEASLAARRDELPSAHARAALDRASASLRLALDASRWTDIGFPSADGDGTDALVGLRAALGRLVWADTDVRDATMQEQAGIVTSMGAAVHHRFDDVQWALGPVSPIDAGTRSLLWSIQYLLRNGDTASTLPHRTLAYISAWRHMLTLQPCCAVAPRMVLGGNDLLPAADSNPAGTAEAFPTTASEDGTIGRIGVYVDPGATATSLVAGVYADGEGGPGTLLGQGRVEDPIPGAWNIVDVAPVAIHGGGRYWIAILGPVGSGSLIFRDERFGGGQVFSVDDFAHDLTELPATWSTGHSFADGPLSAYALPPHVP